ncbi:lipid asymmetry maintenance protein MlaB [Tatumella saanichensis]|uniref:lipid asymmetry maintenance protein MlaB n=1 Tax=Tatumella saanichensis TaxID=480813 RepID=UPI0004A48FE1|nr:lipid asymmetry maintenance protein MlaB [Tatumella saanichensis]
MSDALHWQSRDAVLHLNGKLDHETLQPLWTARDSAAQGISIIDVSGLSRVDSAGLALLVHLQDAATRQGSSVSFVGISDKLQSLITLYNLQQIIVSSVESC